MVRREPLGIVGGIAPWNYPLMMAVWKLGPALAAGNVQVLKPAEQTPLSMLRFVELAQDAIPAGVLNVVTGDGVPVGDALVTHPDDPARLADRRRRDREGDRAHAADNLKRVHLELGGKAPVVVFDDADPERSPRGSRSPATGTRARTARPPRACWPARDLRRAARAARTARSSR